MNNVFISKYINSNIIYDKYKIDNILEDDVSDDETYIDLNVKTNDKFDCIINDKFDCIIDDKFDCIINNDLDGKTYKNIPKYSSKNKFFKKWINDNYEITNSIYKINFKTNNDEINNDETNNDEANNDETNNKINNVFYCNLKKKNKYIENTNILNHIKLKKFDF